MQVDFNFDSGDKALFNFANAAGDDQQVIVHVHHSFVERGEKSYIISAPAAVLKQVVNQPDFSEGISIPEGWWAILADPEELEPVCRVMHIIKEHNE
jgi:hypothetical protein